MSQKYLDVYNESIKNPEKNPRKPLCLDDVTEFYVDNAFFKLFVVPIFFGFFKFVVTQIKCFVRYLGVFRCF